MSNTVEFVNCTSHDVVMLDDQNQAVRVFKPSGTELRYVINWNYEDAGDTTLLSRINCAVLDAMPPEHPGRYYIVSWHYGHYAASTGRNDFVVPGALVRDVSGRALGCRYLQVCQRPAECIALRPAVATR